MKKCYLLLLTSCLFVACNSSDDDKLPEIEEATKNLKISVEEHSVTTDDIDFEFEILEGNGEYIITGSKEGDIKYTIDGNNVTVNLLTNSTTITVTDKKEQRTSFWVYSTSRSLVPTGHTIFMHVDSTSIMDHISFGVGGYTLEKIKGSSAEATVLENDHIKIIGLKGGNSYYTITDKRGTTASLDVIISPIYELTGNNLAITATNDFVINVDLSWGEGDWEIEGNPTTSPFFDIVSVHKAADNKYNEYDSLQINISKNDIKGTANIRLKDKAGNKATITINIE